VAPGFVKTDMTDIMPEEIRNTIVAGIPSKRMGLPIDIANAYRAGRIDLAYCAWDYMGHQIFISQLFCDREGYGADRGA